MIHKKSVGGIIIVGIVVYYLLSSTMSTITPIIEKSVPTITTSLSITTASNTSSSKGELVPLYSLPTNSSWNELIITHQAKPSIPMIAIINPDSGAGSSQDPNYVSGIQRFQAAGIIVLGYVYTSYGTRDIASIETEVTLYQTWYHVNGIFFDEMANIGNITYYSALNNYASSLGMTMNAGNMGIANISGYTGFAITVTYEMNGTLSAISSSGITYSYNGPINYNTLPSNFYEQVMSLS